MNFAKFAATSLSRRADRFRGCPAANCNNLLTRREFSDVKGKTEYFRKSGAVLLERWQI